MASDFFALVHVNTAIAIIYKSLTPEQKESCRQEVWRLMLKSKDMSKEERDALCILFDVKITPGKTA